MVERRFFSGSVPDRVADDYGAAQVHWLELVRRARLPHRFKLALLIVGSYADPDGTRVYPGTARLALDAQIGYSTAKRYLAQMRELGLIERVRRVKIRDKSDEYRLILHPDLLERLAAAGIDLPDPEQYKAMTADMRTENRDGRTAQRTRSIAAILRSI